MDPNETRAVARLPHLEIELRHREAGDGSAEMLSVTLRGAPDLGTAAALLDPCRLLAAWAAFNPWLALWRPLLDPDRASRLLSRPPG